MKDDNCSFWYGVGCGFLERQTGVMLEVAVIKMIFTRHVKIYQHICFGKDREFAFMVFD